MLRCGYSFSCEWHDTGIYEVHHHEPIQLGDPVE